MMFASSGADAPASAPARLPPEASAVRALAPPEQEIIQTLKKLYKLPIRKQRQITDFIEMIMVKKATVRK
ncbi:hypothetical protein MUA03_22340 [Enterobacteriaceae bacterium H16N7]|nr:hypothetical protein [Dryocola clanedunensis]